MKAWMISLVLILSLVIVGNAIADEYITLPNGNQLNITNLSDAEVQQAIRLARKSSGKSDAILDMAKNASPESLDAWRKLITGTIKDVCNDLSLTVNEFVKTPVGIGVAALIVYKVAGKDLLDNALDFIIVVPLWFIFTGLVLFLGWYFFSCKTYYNSISYDEKGKKIKEGVRRQTRYEWDRSSNKENVAYFLIIFEIIITMLGVLIVLA